MCYSYLDFKEPITKLTHYRLLNHWSIVATDKTAFSRKYFPRLYKTTFQGILNYELFSRFKPKGKNTVKSVCFTFHVTLLGLIKIAYHIPLISAPGA